MRPIGSKSRMSENELRAEFGSKSEHRSGSRSATS